jgi:hypothetical protein
MSINVMRGEREGGERKGVRRREGRKEEEREGGMESESTSERERRYHGKDGIVDSP